MRFRDLSPSDRHLLQTDLGDFDKIAEQQVAIIDEMYSTGFNKLAAETADWLDKLAEEEDEEEDEDEMDHDSEKTASVYGAWTERGFFDGLCKLGSDRHGDEMHYLYPFLEEKIAAKGPTMLRRAKDFLHKARKAEQKNRKHMMASGRAAYRGKGHLVNSEGRPIDSKGKVLKGKAAKNVKDRKLSAGQRIRAGAHAALRATPYAAGATALGYGGYRAMHNDEE